MTTPIKPEASAKSGEHHAYVDSIESGLVKLLLKDESGEWRGHTLPATVLPAGIKEGAWLRFALEPSEAPDSAKGEMLRSKLSKTDSGDDFSL